MAEENQVMTNIEENRVTTKDPKKGEVGKRLAEYNHRNREELKAQKNKQLLAVGVIGGPGYYLYQAKVNIIPIQQPSHAFAGGYSMLDEKILKMAPPSIQKFDLEDMGKLVAIIVASEMTREYLIKQKILPEHINV